MKYEEVLDFLYAQLPMYQKVGGKAVKYNLNNIKNFCKTLDNPEQKFKSIHIAGTNGKGSTAHYLASILQEAGYKVGLHTSPHLVDFRERIKTNGKLISKEEVIGFVERFKNITASIKPSFFEWAVALAFYHFSMEKVDIAIIETGMGGRLDSTNVIFPEIAVITNIGLDHCKILGNNLTSIAFEKAGIIKRNTPVVLGEVLPETETVFKEIAKKQNATITIANPKPVQNNFQSRNLETTRSTIQILTKMGWNVTKDNFAKGVENVKLNTGLRGRWETLNTSPKVICDVGHNEDGIKLVVEHLSQEKFNQLHIVLGVSDDKEVKEIFNLLPENAIYYFCKANAPRGMDQNKLRGIAMKHKRIGDDYPSVETAYTQAMAKASPKDLVFVGGSFFVVGEIININN